MKKTIKAMTRLCAHCFEIVIHGTDKVAGSSFDDKRFHGSCLKTESNRWHMGISLPVDESTDQISGLLSACEKLFTLSLSTPTVFENV